MFKYVKSEVFRTFKTPMYKIFLAFSLLASLLVLAVWKPLNINGTNYMKIMALFAMNGIMLVSAFAVVIAYKTKDTKVQILSYGMSRGEMFFADLITMQLVSVLTTLILCAFALLGGFLANTFGLSAIGVEDYVGFMVFVLKLILFNINVNNAIFGLTYLLNNVALGIIGIFMIIPTFIRIVYSFAIGKSYEKLIGNFLAIQPYQLLQFNMELSFNDFTSEIMKYIGASVIYVIICYVVPGLIAFKNREIY